MPTRTWTVLFLVAVLAVPARAQDPAAGAAGLRKQFAAAHVSAADAARKDGLWEEARGEYELALALDDASDPAERGISDLVNERVLAWSDALHKKYQAWKSKREKDGKDQAAKLAASLKGWPDGKKDDGDALARLALQLDPDNAEAHARLGEALAKDAGWLPKAEAESYNKGLRRWGKEWKPAKEVEGKAIDWANAWELRGEHFIVRCAESEKAGRATLGWAEDAYHAFRREFKGLIEFEPPKEGMTIYHFAAQTEMDQYYATLPGVRAGQKLPPGFFSNRDRFGHFCPLPAGVPNTLEEVVKHETTHQICFFAIPGKGDPTQRPHFWAWEGVASYFETLERKDGKLLLGNPNQVRIKGFRAAAAQGRSVPIKDFVLFKQPDMKGEYSQASTLTHFFMNAKSGAYREKFAQYAKIVHEATAEPDTFERVFGAKPESFEAEWVAYVKGLK